MKPLPYSFPAILSLTLFFVGCQSGEEGRGTPNSARIIKYSDLGPPRASLGSVNPQATSSNYASFMVRQPTVPHNRLVVVSAEVAIEVKNCDEALVQIKLITASNDGFVAHSTANQMTREQGSMNSGEVTIRIPFRKFDQTLSRIKQHAIKVERETIRGNDVTEDYYDLAARLKNKQRAEERYLAVFQRATRVKEILQVEEALSAVREEIDLLIGRKKYLEDQSELSTFVVKMHEPAREVVFSESTFLARVGSGFDRGVKGFNTTAGYLVAFFVAAGPYLVIILLAAYIFMRARALRRDQQPSA